MIKSRNNCSAKVVLDSIGPNGKRIVTVEARYWRGIHSELMTHRDRARNAASSRAIPFIRYGKCSGCNGTKVDNGSQCDYCNGTGVGGPVPNCTYSYIENDPFLPEFIGTEQKGMQSGSELMEPFRTAALKEIDDLRHAALATCKRLFDLGVHKSIINRYLEPWSYITVVMTATEWKNFFRLRIHPKAEKHFNKIAGKIKAAIDNSVPTPLLAGEWHMPYLLDEERKVLTLGKPGFGTDVEVAAPYLGLSGNQIGLIARNLQEVLKEISAARCARLSYLTHDGKRDVEADLRIFNTLIRPKIEEDRDDDVIHSSPLEHVNQASCRNDLRSGPMVGWFQMRKEFPNENVEG